MTAPWALVADIGGTNVRFARTDADGRLFAKRHYTVSGTGSFMDALDAYLDQSGPDAGCAGAALAGAGPVSNDRIDLTNNAWTVEASPVSARLAGAPVRLFNDLQAAALSLPCLSGSDLDFVRGPEQTQAGHATRLAVNVGTGFGASALVHDGASWISVPGEAGHMSLAATDREELALLLENHSRFRSVEDVLSGSGLEALYAHIRRTGTDLCGPVTLSAAEIFRQRATNAAAGHSANMFERLLARTCGDLVLATGAWGGVFLFGSVLKGWRASASQTSAFEAAFLSKGEMSDRMSHVPVHMVENDDAPLIGLARNAPLDV